MAGQEIDRKDREFGPFLRSLGAMAVSTGNTIGESANRIDITSFPALETDLTRLRRRLAAALIQRFAGINLRQRLAAS